MGVAGDPDHHRGRPAQPTAGPSTWILTTTCGRTGVPSTTAPSTSVSTYQESPMATRKTPARRTAAKSETKAETRSRNNLSRNRRRAGRGDPEVGTVADQGTAAPGARRPRRGTGARGHRPGGWRTDPHRG